MTHPPISRSIRGLVVATLAAGLTLAGALPAAAVTPSPLTVTMTADMLAALPGGTVNLTATINHRVPSNPYRSTMIELYLSSGTMLASCDATATTTCSRSVTQITPISPDQILYTAQVNVYAGPDVSLLAQSNAVNPSWLNDLSVVAARSTTNPTLVNVTTDTGGGTINLPYHVSIYRYVAGAPWPRVADCSGVSSCAGSDNVTSPASYIAFVSLSGADPIVGVEPPDIRSEGVSPHPV